MLSTATFGLRLNTWSLRKARSVQQFSQKFVPDQQFRNPALSSRINEQVSSTGFETQLNNPQETPQNLACRQYARQPSLNSVMKHNLWHNHQLFCHRRHGNGHVCHLLNKTLLNPVLGKTLTKKALRIRILSWSNTLKSQEVELHQQTCSSQHNTAEPCLGRRKTPPLPAELACQRTTRQSAAGLCLAPWRW